MKTQQPTQHLKALDLAPLIGSRGCSTRGERTKFTSALQHKAY